MLCLVLLSPGIPEYLSGSSKWAFLTINPIVFFLFLGLNVALYGPGVMLIREAVVRWKRGWASVFLLGFGYAILEEGLALSTLYNPKADPVQGLGVYGHWLGVNWVWSVGILLFHSAISIALPILLFRLAFPALKSKSLLSNGKATLSVIMFGFDSLALFAIVGYWAGWPIILGSALAVGVFVFAARKASAGLLTAKSLQPTRRPRTLGILGVVFFPVSVLIGAVLSATSVPPLVTMALEVILTYLIFRTIVNGLGHQDNQRHKVALAIGLVLPIMVFGLIASILSSPLIILADAVFAYFLVRVRRRYRGLLPGSFMSGMPMTGPEPSLRPS